MVDRYVWARIAKVEQALKGLPITDEDWKSYLRCFDMLDDSTQLPPGVKVANLRDWPAVDVLFNDVAAFPDEVQPGFAVSEQTLPYVVAIPIGDLVVPTPPGPDQKEERFLRYGPDSADIQGNILAGFNKPFVAYMFARVTAADKALNWLRLVIPFLATNQYVAEFNDRSKEHKAGDPRRPASAWINLAFTWNGLTRLDTGLEASKKEMERWFPAFVKGAVGRAPLNGESATEATPNWAIGEERFDLMLTLAADTRVELNKLIARMRALADDADFGTRFCHPDDIKHIVGVTSLSQVESRRPNSQIANQLDTLNLDVRRANQPRVRGFDATSEDESATPAGEFIVGHANADDHRFAGPRWLRNGSFQVFRKLDVNLQNYRALAGTVKESLLTTRSAEAGALVDAAVEHYGQDFATLGAMPTDLETLKQVVDRTGVLGAESESDVRALVNDMYGEWAKALLIGRWPDGLPLLQADPALATPAKWFTTSLAFREKGIKPGHRDWPDLLYGMGPDNDASPLFAHVRKMGPDPESPTRHRLLRRGVIYSPELSGQRAVKDQHTVLFSAFMASIEDQFEYLLTNRANNPNYPARPGEAGYDPIIGHRPQGKVGGNGGSQPFIPLTSRGDDGGQIPVRPNPASSGRCPFTQLSTTAGGLNLFCPSITALRHLAAGTMSGELGARMA